MDPSSKIQIINALYYLQEASFNLQPLFSSALNYTASIISKGYSPTIENADPDADYTAIANIVSLRAGIKVLTIDYEKWWNEDEFGYLNVM